MKTQLKENEEGFSLIDLLVIIFIIAVLYAITAPVLNRTSGEEVDKQVEEDVYKVSSMVDEWVYYGEHSNVIIPDADITSNSNTVFGEIGDLSEGTSILVRGNNIPGQYCLYGINEDGYEAGKNAGILYDSAVVGSYGDYVACPTNGNYKPIVPDEIRDILPTDSKLYTSTSIEESNEELISSYIAVRKSADGEELNEYGYSVTGVFNDDGTTIILINFNYSDVYGYDIPLNICYKETADVCIEDSVTVWGNSAEYNIGSDMEYRGILSEPIELSDGTFLEMNN